MQGRHQTVGRTFSRVRAERRRCPLSVGPKIGDHRPPTADATCIAPGVVGDDDRAAREHGHQRGDVGPAGEIDDRGARRRIEGRLDRRPISRSAAAPTSTARTPGPVTPAIARGDALRRPLLGGP